MNQSRIEQAIDEIYNYVEDCKPSKLYPNKVVVERGELYDLLDELRLCAPEEIKRYQKIINNRDGILGEAQKRAADMVAQAQQQTAAKNNQACHPAVSQIENGGTSCNGNHCRQHRQTMYSSIISLPLHNLPPSTTIRCTCHQMYSQPQTP